MAAPVSVSWEEVTRVHWQAVGGQGQARDSDSDSSRSVDAYGEEDEAWVEEHVSAEDEAALAAFLNPGAAGQQQRTLSDIILSKIRERQAPGDVAFTAECALELRPLLVCALALPEEWLLS